VEVAGHVAPQAAQTRTDESTETLLLPVDQRAQQITLAVKAWHHNECGIVND